jgi:hypothetical protein
LVGADASLSRARDHGAEERATYEYIMATRFLDKAREEFAESQYRVCEALSKHSADWSDRAIITIESEGGKADFSGDDLSNTAPSSRPAPAAAPVPAPAAQPLDPLFEPTTTQPTAAPEPEPEPEPEPDEYEDLEDIDLEDDEFELDR